MSFVYKFMDYNENIIYIGKTNNIEKRMKTHFGKDGHLPQECYQNVAKIFYIEVDGKTNVDMYETYLINKYLPKYNTEKVFNEIMELHYNAFINVEEIEWQQLYFQFGKNGIKIAKKRISYPFFARNIGNIDKCIALLEYNYYQMIYSYGIYNYNLRHILNENKNFIEYIEALHKEIIDNRNYIPSKSCFDEPVNEYNNSFEYVAIDINKLKNINLKYLFLMIQSRMLVRIDTNYYGIVAHTPYALSLFDEFYKNNEYEI